MKNNILETIKENLQSMNEYLFGNGQNYQQVSIQPEEDDAIEPPKGNLLKNRKKKKQQVKEELEALLKENYEELPTYIHRLNVTHKAPGEKNARRDTFEVESLVKHPYKAQDEIRNRLKRKGHEVLYVEHGGTSEK